MFPPLKQLLDPRMNGTYPGKSGLFLWYHVETESLGITVLENWALENWALENPARRTKNG